MCFNLDAVVGCDPSSVQRWCLNGTLHNPRIHHGMHGTWHVSVASKGPLAFRTLFQPYLPCPTSCLMNTGSSLSHQQQVQQAMVHDMLNCPLPFFPARMNTLVSNVQARKLSRWVTRKTSKSLLRPPSREITSCNLQWCCDKTEDFYGFLLRPMASKELWW